nr:MAG TPA: hypothetical protein [Caudoviricetes sp.]
MTTLVFGFKGRYTSGSMLASSFRLQEIKQMLSRYGEVVTYNIDEDKHLVDIILSETLSEEQDKEISILLADYFHRNYNKLHTYPDIAKEMEYTNGEG